MDLEHLFAQLGFEQKESVVYIASLQLGKATAFQIASLCKLKRPTVYLKLADLKIKGLIRETKTKKATLYEALSPAAISEQLETRTQKLAEAMPLLMSIFKQNREQPHIQILEGLPALRALFKKTTACLAEGREVLVFGSMAHIKDIYPIEAKRWNKAISRIGARARELLNDDAIERTYARAMSKASNPSHRIRFAPKGAFSNDNVIFDKKLCIFSYRKGFYATIIETKEVVDSYRAFFDLAWEAAKDVK